MDAAVRTSDEALVQRFQNGDLTAFDELHRKYEKQLYCQILSIVHNHQDTEEIVQETFFKAYQELFTLCCTHSFRAWLATVAKHKSIDHVRKVRRRALSVSLESDASAILLEDREPSPDEVTIAHERWEETFHQLKPQVRTVLHLTALGYEPEEIAQRTHLSVKSVHTYLSNGWRELSRHLSLPARRGKRSGPQPPLEFSKKDLLPAAPSILVNE